MFAHRSRYSRFVSRAAVPVKTIRPRARRDLWTTSRGTDVSKPKGKVQRVEDWDEARYSVLPARVAMDERLEKSHLLVLIYIGRVNTQNGWCEFSQTSAADLFGLRRQAVNAAVSDLTEWCYIEKLSQQETKSSVCHYRVLIDSPDCDDEDVSAPGDTATTDHVSAPGDTPPEGGVRSRRHPCPPQQTPVSAPSTDTHCRSEIKDLPPLPPAASATQDGGEGEDCSNQIFIDRLRDDGIALPQCEALLIPLLQVKPFRTQEHPDRMASLLAIRTEIAKCAPDVLANALPAILRDRHVLPGLSKLLEFVAKDAAPAGKHLAINRWDNPREFGAWQVYYDRERPALGRLMRDNGRAAVPAQFPPDAAVKDLALIAGAAA